MTDSHRAIPIESRRDTIPPETGAPRSIEERVGEAAGAAVARGIEGALDAWDRRQAAGVPKPAPGLWVAVAAFTAIALNILSWVVGGWFILNHEAKSGTTNDAILDLSELLADHADCSEDSFRALAANEPPPRCPNRARKQDKIESSLGR